MNSNDNWIAEQARLIDLEDGFGPNYPTKVKSTSTASESEAAAA